MSIAITLPDIFLSFNKRDFAKYADDFTLKPGGIYVFYNESDECIYVGKSKRLASRLRTHFSSSPFAEEIDRIDVYSVENPLDRELYETYTINALGGIYNKAKVYINEGANPLIADEIDTLEFEIELLRKEREGVVEDLRQVTLILHPPAPRKYSNITQDISRSYVDYVNYIRPDAHSTKLAREESEHRRLTSRLSEIDEEIVELNAKITEYLRKLIT